MNLVRQKPIAIIAVISAVYLVYAMIALVIYRNQVFAVRNIFLLPEFIISLGIGITVIFDFISVGWLSYQLFITRKASVIKIFSFVFGLICLISLAIEKTMIDEIGKEFGSSVEAFGEWLILYGFWIAQLLYNGLVFKISKTDDDID